MIEQTVDEQLRRRIRKAVAFSARIRHEARLKAKDIIKEAARIAGDVEQTYVKGAGVAAYIKFLADKAIKTDHEQMLLDLFERMVGVGYLTPKERSMFKYLAERALKQSLVAQDALERPSYQRCGSEHRIDADAP